EAFADMRERFLARWKSEFAPLRLETIPLARLEQQVAAFRREHSTFPLQTNLVRIWLQGESDETFIGEWVILLRGFMEEHIRADEAIMDEAIQPLPIRLLPEILKQRGESVASLESQGVVVSSTQVRSLSQVRTLL